MVYLHGLVDEFKKGKVYDPSGHMNIKKFYPQQSEWFFRESKDAVCFDVGHAQEVPVVKTVIELFKLPFPVCWFEFEMFDGKNGCLFSQVGDHKYHVGVFDWLQKKDWRFIGVFEIDNEAKDELYISSVAVFSEKLVNKDGELYNDAALQYAAKALSNAKNFIMALNCSNVKAAETQPPKFAARQRIAKGKQPMYSYWTLHIPGSGGSGEHQGGTHASPRVHLRRGHIRRFENGKFTWVQAHIVGDKKNGVVHKDYAFDASNKYPLQ